jgi:coiled-coil domain-containing protein 6
MERLEAEKRLLQEKLDQPVSAPLSPRNLQTAQLATSLTNNQTGSQAIAAATLNLVGLPPSNSEQAATLTEHIINLRREVSKLKANLEKAERDHKENMAKLVREEKVIRDENVRLQRRLQMEVDRREALCRHLSESESSLEMDDERHFNESSRVRTISSPVTGYAAAANTSASNANQAIVQTNTNNNLFSQPASSTNNLVTNQQHAPLINQSQPAQSTDRCPACNQIKLNNLNLVSSPPLVIGRQPPVPSSQVNPLTASSSLSSSSSSINSSKLQNVVPATIGQNNPHVQQAHQLSTSSPMELSKK